MIRLKFEGVIVTERIDGPLAEHLRKNLKDVRGVRFTTSTIVVTGSQNRQSHLRFLECGAPFHYHQIVASVTNETEKVHLLFDFHRQELRPASRNATDSFQRFIFRNALMVTLKQNGFVRIALMHLPIHLEKPYYKELVLFEDFLPFNLLCFKDALTIVPENYRDLVEKAHRRLERIGRENGK